MKVLIPGHKYTVTNYCAERAIVATPSEQTVYFVLDAKYNPDAKLSASGTNCQELLRVLIDRVRFLNGQRRWDGNQRIIEHLRMALALFEARALERKAEKGFSIELFTTDVDGHLKLSEE